MDIKEKYEAIYYDYPVKIGTRPKRYFGHMVREIPIACPCCKHVAPQEHVIVGKFSNMFDAEQYARFRNELEWSKSITGTGLGDGYTEKGT